MYRAITPKARLIPLSDAFVRYLRSDGIILPPENNEFSSSTDADSGVFSASTSPTVSDSEDEDEDPSLPWSEIHTSVKQTIAELKGSVHPKLNWSAPKDATWIAATNSMECRTPNDIYLLLKSSDFITHDLEQVFDDCEEASEDDSLDSQQSGTTSHKPDPMQSIPYHLVLRKTIPAFVTSLEFRCFTRKRRLLCMCQRDLNHYQFLPDLVPRLRFRTEEFFEKYLRDSFPDENFVFDVYIPAPHDKVWLIDINPWAPRTDPLLFSWLEILGMGDIGKSQEASEYQDPEYNDKIEGINRDDSEDIDYLTEFRLVNRDDPEAYSFNTPQYSAHKLPKEVVDASGDGEAGLRDFMGRWRDILKKQEQEDDETD
ncbi:MAG: hypothetical protein Q9191_003270 [Dirinaria sp. TL-2023a]